MSERPTDWKNEPETLYFESGTKKNKKGKKKPQYEIYEPPAAPESTAPGSMGPGGAGTGNDYGSNYTPGKKPTSTGISSTANSNYDTSIGSSTLNAPRGSLASGIADSQLNMVAANPYEISNQYMMNQGLQSQSAIAGLASNLYNPLDKAVGIMGDKGFSSDIDAINFGEDLLDQFMTGGGQQLNGMQMVETALVAFAEAARNPLGGGGGVGGKLSAIALDPNPTSQLDSMLGVIEGILVGTMPEDSANALLGQMQRVGQAFLSGMARDMNPMESEKAGKNMANALLNWLQAKI